MKDRLTREQRSWNMSRIRGKNTGPELTVRSMLHRHGYRFRLGSSSLPGRPDIVLAKYRTAIFIDGCFWHACPRHGVRPKNNAAFWRKKIIGNRKRDLEVSERIRRLGWKVLRIWEHDIRRADERILMKRIDGVLHQN